MFFFAKNTGIIFTLISYSYFCVICTVFRSATHARDLCFCCLLGYIEVSKARIYHSGDDSVALVAQTVLLYVFKNILKLLHPFMPFVTEELWQALPNRREALIISSWPQTSLPRSTDLVKRFENLQALVIYVLDSSNPEC
ncbi:hypothetical protein ES332_D12G167200v1 [Gossypium tomentosum]|uniref:valine--tRNA ligase n=1 Tax=Gossypium tomentosum TaxID=34277 RepID=A0A5D2IAX6_GOSTO|nr:hypothetical protein ES332_D12G167200v1 [Gossypium tomentosum]